MKTVVIGGGAAGATAAARAKRISPENEVILIERTSLVSHAPCGIPYAIGGIAYQDRLYAYTPEDFEREKGVKVLTHTNVIDIDIDSRSITLLRDDRQEKLRFDKLIIATGAKPIVPNIEGANNDKTITIRHPAYILQLIEKIRNANRIVIIGGGYLGVEMAENLIRLRKEVTLVERLPLVMYNSLDAEFAQIVTDIMKSWGVKLALGETVYEIKDRGDHVEVITDNNIIRGDLVVMAVGAIPDSELAEKAGIPLGVKRAIKVNQHMETMIDGIFAAGDVAEKTHRLLNEKVWIPLATTANKEGYVAGTNAIHDRLAIFPGIVGTSITKFGDLYIAKTGLSEREAVDRGIDVEAGTIRVKNRPKYYPGGTEVWIKLVVRKSDRAIIGAQLLGYTEMISGYIDSLAIAIEKGTTVDELFFMDLSYMPAISTVWHPLIKAARVLKRTIGDGQYGA